MPSVVASSWACYILCRGRDGGSNDENEGYEELMDRTCGSSEFWSHHGEEEGRTTASRSLHACCFDIHYSPFKFPPSIPERNANSEFAFLSEIREQNIEDEGEAAMLHDFELGGPRPSLDETR